MGSGGDPEKAVYYYPRCYKRTIGAGIGKKSKSRKFPLHNWEDHIVPLFMDARRLVNSAGLSQREIELLQIAVL